MCIRDRPDPKDRRKNCLFVNEEAIPKYKVYRMQMCIRDRSKTAS